MLNELQQKLLNMLSWFHDFCETEKLNYYVLGGTMLGAIRHKGFIPWDDDIDIGMPREDYKKLALLMNAQTGKYILETPDTNKPDFYYPFSKIYDTETTLVENTKYKIKRGIYLDIFPLDGIGNTIEESKKNFQQIKKLNNLLMLKTAGYRKGRSFIKNCGVMLFRLIPLNAKKLLHKVDDACAKKDFSDCIYCGNLVGNWKEKEIMPRSFFGKSHIYQFENIKIFGPENYDAYLKNLYGNYMKLPPKEKQKSHHDYIEIDINKPYQNK